MSHMGLLFAQGKGAGYASNSSEAERIRDLNTFYDLKKWGWVIYRCTYGDDDAWSRFIDRLNRHKDAVLRDDYQTPDLIGPYDWNVQEDPALNGATKDEVRRRFRQLRASLVQDESAADLEDFKKQALMRENPRYNYCIHVDAEALHAVLQRASDFFEGPITGHVNLVRADESWDMPDFDRFDWDKYESEKEWQKSNDGPGDEDGEGDEDDEDEDEDEYDDGEPEIEGSRLSDVGWMMVKVDSLIPETYATLIKSFMWDNIYRRPPQVMER